jgi:hypothetical protein
MLSRAFERTLQKRNLSDWKRRADRLTKSDDLYHQRGGTPSSPPPVTTNKRSSAPNSPSYESKRFVLRGVHSYLSLEDFSFSSPKEETTVDSIQQEHSSENLKVG